MDMGEMYELSQVSKEERDDYANKREGEVFEEIRDRRKQGGKK